MKTGKTLYFDHQATTPVDRRVLDQMLPYLTDSFGNPHSAHHVLGWESARAVEEAAECVGRLIGADSDEVVFTSGATESNNLALLGLGRRAAGGQRRRILMSTIEHKCVLSVGRVLAEQYGYTVEQVPVDQEGFVSISALERALDDDVLAVSIMAVNNEIGTIQDIESISKAIGNFGAVFHCDAAQAPIAMTVNALARYADILSLSGHKIYGPKGVGAIFVRRGLEKRIEPLIYGGGQQNGLRSGTVPTPLCVGMGAAANLLSGPEAEAKRVRLWHLSNEFISRLRKLSVSVVINGPAGNARHPGNVNACFVGIPAQDLLGTLQPRLAASTGSACSSGIPEPSHVLRAIGLSGDEADSSIRFSLGFDTTEEDIQEAVGLIEEAIDRTLEPDMVSSA